MLVVVLWLLVILTVLVLGVGRRSSLERAITKYRIAKLQSKYAALAGLVYAENQIAQDNRDTTSNRFDTLAALGIPVSANKTAEDLFKHIKIPAGNFDVHPAEQDLTVKETRYGLSDEESRINLNALSVETTGVLKALLVDLGVDENVADTISASVVDWRDEDSIALNQFGAEEDYYRSLPVPYSCKNKPFNSVEELTLVKGMTPDILQQIKSSVTVFPASGRLLINFDTASRRVLLALANNFSGAKSNTDESDAGSLVEKILAYRSGPDGVAGISQQDIDKIGLNTKERAIFLMMLSYQTKVSRFLRVDVQGHNDDASVGSRLVAVVDREDFSVLSWQRD